jgi:hypothetical protein
MDAVSGLVFLLKRSCCIPAGLVRFHFSERL